MGCYCNDMMCDLPCTYCERRNARLDQKERGLASLEANAKKINQKRREWHKRDDECNRIFLLFVSGKRPELGSYLGDSIRRHNKASDAPPALPWKPPNYRVILEEVDKSYTMHRAAPTDRKQHGEFSYRRREFDKQFAEHAGEWVPPEERDDLEWHWWHWNEETCFYVLRKPAVEGGRDLR